MTNLNKEVGGETIAGDAQDLWFSEAEYRARLARLRSAMAELDLDALLLFEPESVTYITGFFTMGYSTSFQFAIVPVDADPIVVLRDVERFYFNRTSAYGLSYTWADGEDPDTVMVRAAEETLGPRSPGHVGRLGVEARSWLLNAARYESLRGALSSWELVDASRIVPSLRFIKSEAEVDLMRRAARIAEYGMAAAAATVGQGVSERDVAAAVWREMIRKGADHGTDLAMASGERAFHIHGIQEDRSIERGDLVHVEVGPVVRQYHARFMRSFKVGPFSQQEREWAIRLAEVQDLALESVRDGAPVSRADSAYRLGVQGLGFEAEYTNKTFYSVGLMLYPNTFEPLEVTRTSDWVFRRGQTFHTYVIARGICWSETILVTADGYEKLTGFSREPLAV